LPFGIIIKGISGFYYIKTADKIYECKARGVFRKNSIVPLPGDRVEFSVIDDAENKGLIDKILERDCELTRPAVANVNQIAIVVAVKSPDPDLMLVDKLLVTAEIKNVNPIICINKIDLDNGNMSKKIHEAYSKAKYPVIHLSTKTCEGFEDLEKILTGKITVFAGQSGVGKSSILNVIMDSMIMKTGEVSHKIQRGRHTTRHAELLELKSGGYVVDTPGFSSFELSGIAFDKLDSCYREFEEYKTKCRFVGCSHLTEPQCGVKDALSKGEIDFGRYERYAQLYNILKEIDSNKYRKK